MRKTVDISDLTGEELNDPATIKLTVGATTWIVDVNSDEEIVGVLQAAGRTQAKRGRKKRALAAA